jgi:hypothetical protein
MSRAIIFTRTILVAGLVVLPIAHAATQSQTTGAPASTLSVDQDLADMKDLAEQGIRLKADTETALNTLREKQAALDTILRDVKGARQFTEDMIRLLQEAADRLAPESSYMKTLQAQEDIVRGLASEALASTNPADHPFAETFTRQASEITALASEARDFGARLTAQVELLKQSKSQIGYAYAARRTDEFIKTAKAYLDAARGVLTGASDLAAKSRSINAQSIPTQ